MYKSINHWVCFLCASANDLYNFVDDDVIVVAKIIIKRGLILINYSYAWYCDRTHCCYVLTIEVNLNSTYTITTFHHAMYIHRNTYRWRFFGFVSHFLRTANKFSTVRCTSDSHGPNCGFSFWILKNFDCVCMGKQSVISMVNFFLNILKWFQQLRNCNHVKSKIYTLTFTQSTVFSFIVPVGRLGTDGTTGEFGFATSSAFFP